MKQTDRRQLGAQEILANRMISLADLRGRKEAAAARLRVSIATFKRKRREHGINHRWPDPKEIKDPIQMASENLGSSDDGRTSLALKAQQDTGFVLIKAIHGNSNLLFLFLVASGIIGLKEEVLKKLKFEVDSFDVKCKDHQGHLISIACDDDLMSYLNVFKPSGNQACRLFVISKIPN